jgi:purine-binding chemotaxis protein CheW
VLSVPHAQAEAMPGILATDESLQEFTSICRLDDGKRLVSIIATDKLLRMPAISQAVQAAQTVQATQALHQAAGLSTADSENSDMNANERDSDQADRSDDDIQVVVFRLGAEEFGVPIMSVQEIVRVPDTLTRVPKTPAFVEGVINLRGTVLPVIDQRSRLGLPVVSRSESQRIMVYMLGGLRTGFIVDSVAEVLRIPLADIVPAPNLSDEQSRLISRVANLQGSKRLVMLIDPQHLLHGREMQAMQQLNSGAGAAPATALPLAKAA